MKFVQILLIFIVADFLNALKDDVDLTEEEKILVQLEKTLRMKEKATEDKALMALEEKEGILKDITADLDTPTVSKKKKRVVKTNKMDNDLTLEDATKELKKEEKNKVKDVTEEDVLEEVKALLKEALFQKDSPSNNLPKKDEKKDLQVTKKEDSQSSTKQNQDEKINSKVSRKEALPKAKLEDEVKAIDMLVEHQKRETETCKDVLPLKDCYRFAYNGTCNTHPEEMAKRCKRSCCFCCADDTTSQICTRVGSLRDPLDTCHSNNHHEKLRIICPKLCQRCGKAMSEIPCIRSKYGCCWDGSTAKNHVGLENDGCPACENHYSENLCEMFAVDCHQLYTAGEQVRAMCPKSCRRCGAHAICKDDPQLQDTCAMMKHQGLCEKAFYVMKFYCPKTCGICKTTSIDCKLTRYGCCADGKTIAKGTLKEGCPECHDKPATPYRCKFLAKHNACKTHKKIMADYCGGSCKFCVQ